MTMISVAETTPHGLLAVRPAAQLAVRAPGVVDVHLDDGDDESALETAATVMRTARHKGLPRAWRPTSVGGRIEVSLPFAHMIQWVDMLDGLGYASERTQPDFDPAEENPPGVWVTALPHHEHGDFSIHGWTNVDGEDGDTRPQQWVLRPLVEHDCRRCADLPEPASPPLSAEAWRADAWWQLVGKRWEEPTGPRAHLVPHTDGEAGRHRSPLQLRAAR